MDNQSSLAIYEPNYEKISKLGEGTFGKVHKCKNTTTGAIFSVKIIRKIDFNLRSILAEINILLKIPEHKRLVTCYGITNENNCINIFMEYMSKGSLKEEIDKNGKLVEPKVAVYVKKILEGIDFLHQNNVIHRDIKCANILLDDQDNIKLTDFGLSKVVEENTPAQHTYCGTSYYMAPEIYMKDKYDFAVDIWALGVTIVEMFTGLPIYSELKGAEFIKKLTSIKEVQFVLPSASSNLVYFVKLTFTINSAVRPKANDLFKTKFLKTVVI